MSEQTWPWNAEADEVLALAAQNPDSPYLGDQARRVRVARDSRSARQRQEADRFASALGFAASLNPGELKTDDAQYAWDELDEVMRGHSLNSAQRADVWAYVARSNGEWQ